MLRLLDDPYRATPESLPCALLSVVAQISNCRKNRSDMDERGGNGEQAFQAETGQLTACRLRLVSKFGERRLQLRCQTPDCR